MTLGTTRVARITCRGDVRNDKGRQNDFISSYSIAGFTANFVSFPEIRHGVIIKRGG